MIVNNAITVNCNLIVIGLEVKRKEGTVATMHGPLFQIWQWRDMRFNNAFREKQMWENHLLGQGKLNNFAGCREEGDGEEGIEGRENEKIGTEDWQPRRRE